MISFSFLFSLLVCFQFILWLTIVVYFLLFSYLDCFIIIIIMIMYCDYYICELWRWWFSLFDRVSWYWMFPTILANDLNQSNPWTLSHPWTSSRLFSLVLILIPFTPIICMIIYLFILCYDSFLRRWLIDGFFFFPAEGFGFSDYFHKGIKKPVFDDFDFVVEQDEIKIIKVKMRYF